MPRDRKAHAKAVREAWKRERELVLEGKGTRDWSEEQQLEIIELEKVYDEDGHAYEGQHMKSASAFPEHQGNPDNIQLLSVQEHFRAHKENWQTQTNWYYDPETFEYTCFGDGDPVPCTIIELSCPFAVERRSDTVSIPCDSEKTDANRKNLNSALKTVNKQTKKVSRSGRIRERIRSIHEGILIDRFYTENQAYYDDPVEKYEACMEYLDAYSNYSSFKRAMDIARTWIKPIAGNPDIQKFASQMASYGIQHTITKKLGKHTRQPIVNNDLMKQPTVGIEENLEDGVSHSSGLTDGDEEQLQNNGTFNVDGLRQCSKLYCMGYTTKKSSEERHDILDEFISMDGVEKAKDHLQFLINTRSAMKNGKYEKAVSKWQEDLEYLSEQ